MVLQGVQMPFTLNLSVQVTLFLSLLLHCLLQERMLQKAERLAPGMYADKLASVQRRKAARDAEAQRKVWLIVIAGLKMIGNQNIRLSLL